MADANRLAAALRYQQDMEGPVTMNPNIAEQGRKGRANMAPPTSVMDPRSKDYERKARETENFLIGADILTGALPFVPLAKSAVMAAGRFSAPKIAQGLENYMGRTGMTLNAAPQDEALRLAQQRAALPVEQYGLGLSAENTATQRAAAMDAIDYIHGTQRLDRLLSGKTIDPKRATSGPMPYGTNDPQIASNYAKGKADTSLINEGDISQSFQVTPKQLGISGKTPLTVEQSWNFLPANKKAEILDKYHRVGYENLDEFTGPYTLHPSGVDASLGSRKHMNFSLKQAQGNPLKALRDVWHDSGQIFNTPEDLAQIYKLSGYEHQISNTNAPWFQAQGIMPGKALISNPLNTADTQAINDTIIPALTNAFKKDRTKLKIGADQWAKESAFTPKAWIDQLAKDSAAGKNSNVWTSIPDKVTEQLKQLGYNGIVDTGGKMGGQSHQVVIPFSSDQVRSKFAAFDPFRRNAALAAALGVAAPDLLAEEK